MSTQIVRVRDVFVAGGTPWLTYNPRTRRGLEVELRIYLDQVGKALSISGRTKSGKTVLVERLLPRHSAVWIQGSDLTSVAAFWRAIVDALGLWDNLEYSTERQRGDSSSLSGSIGVPNAAQVSGGLSTNDSTTISSTRAHQRAYADLSREALQTSPVPIVIDDFHFVAIGVRREIARAIKSLIRYTPVIMIAVSRDAFDPIRRHPDLQGRVWHLTVPAWERRELEFIARSGFAALGLVEQDPELVRRLARESRGTPFLMQQLCHDLCTEANIRAVQQEGTPIHPPSSWDDFLSRSATHGLTSQRSSRRPKPARSATPPTKTT